MFHKTSLRLAGLYLVIIMIISLLFSATLYNISARELDRGFRRQGSFIDNYPDDDLRLPPKFEGQLIKNRAEVIRESKARLLGNLAVANLIIFFISGFLSYLLARSSLKPIEESHHALEQFTADASHELRTPLAAMKAEIEVILMQNKITDNQARQVLRSNLEEIDSITNITQGLLSLARLEDMKLAIDSYSVKQLISLATKKLEDPAQDRGIKIIVDPVQPDQKVKVDKTKFVEALVIILDNAVKYSEDNSKIEIGHRLDNDKVEISIKDNGLGIDKLDLPHIFDRLYQSQNHRSKSINKGHGLGLSIAQQLLLRQNCTIQIDSVKGEYTLVNVAVPASI